MGKCAKNGNSVITLNQHRQPLIQEGFLAVLFFFIFIFIHAVQQKYKRAIFCDKNGIVLATKCTKNPLAAGLHLDPLMDNGAYSAPPDPAFRGGKTGTEEKRGRGRKGRGVCAARHP